MLLLSDGVFLLTGLLHLWFLILEMFLWEKPQGLKAFGQSREQASASAVLAKNQGLYNGFLALGIGWGLIEGHGHFGLRVRLFFGACIAIAGIYGALTTGRRTILFVQTAPALMAIALLLGSRLVDTSGLR